MQRTSGIDHYVAPDGKTYYNDGGPGGGGPSTVPKAGDLNAVVEEVARFIESQGLTLAPGPDEPGDITDADYGQLTTAINRSAVGSDNLILNPQLRIAQESVGPWASIGDTAEHLCDMWQAIGDESPGVGTISVTRVAKGMGDLSPWEFSASISGTATVKNPTIFQKIEDVKTLAGQSLSISLVGRNFGGSGTLRVRVTQVFGTGGSPSPDTVAGAVDLTLTGTDATLSATFNLESVAAKTLGTGDDDHLLVEIEIFAAAGTTYFSEVHCVPGEVTKPFRARPISEELSRCRRYYEASTPNGVTPGDWVTANGPSGLHRMYRASGHNLTALASRFQTEKRATPAMYWYEGWGPTGLPIANGTYGKVIMLPDGGAMESRSVSGVTGITKASTGSPSAISGAVASTTSLAGHWTADARL